MGRYVKAKRVDSERRAFEQRQSLRASARTGQHSLAIAPGEAGCAGLGCCAAFEHSQSGDAYSHARAASIGRGG